MGDIVLNNGTVITAEELAEIASEVKKLIAKEAKEPSQYEEVQSLANLTTLPALLQNGAVYQLVRARVELLKGKDAKEIELRLSETAIQWRRDGDDTWQDLITVEKIQEPAKATIAAAEKATEDAITAEAERKSGWQAWFEHATTGVKAIWNKWFGETKTDWTAFDTAASQAESDRELEEQVRLSAENIRNSAENERQSAETARASAEITRQSQESSRVSAETARQNEEAVRQSNESSRETAEEVRVNAESARVNAETSRQSAWVAWFEHATTGVKAVWNSWFGTTKSDWNTFNTSANQAESNRATEYASLREDIVAKTEAADEAADRVDESILDVSKEKELAIAAAKNANEKIGEMNMGLARLEELEATLTAKDRQQPTSMKLTYPKKITFGNMTEQRIKATLSPAGTGSNVLFLSDNQSVSVAPDGRISVLQAGRSFVHVIPTENTGIYQTVEINVNEPTLRLVSATSLRVDSDGNFRLN